MSKGINDGTIITILLLSQAMGRFNKKLLWLPDTSLLCIHGSKDTVCDISDTYKLIEESSGQLIIINDIHSLNSLCSDYDPNVEK